jgi:hypothetical protein
VELRPFNDRRLNRDLEAICAQVNAEEPRLPDGRRLRFKMRAQGTRGEDFAALMRTPPEWPNILNRLIKVVERLVQPACTAASCGISDCASRFWKKRVSVLVNVLCDTFDRNR